ncbi:MAG: hypothetical protein PHU68_04620 [Paludibacter sp.]|nr:hypothetical protein [Paludibacter sp.]
MKRTLINNIKNIFGWRTNRRIIVFESDDWGSIRVVSKEVLEKFIVKGYQTHKCPYDANDRIESNSDLIALIKTLSSVRDFKGNHPIFTINNIVANPNFEKIKISNFKKYFFEPFTTTLERYPDTNLVMDLYNEGLRKKVFQIQFHGREHLNINKWMTRLQENDETTMEAFKEKMISVHHSGSISGKSHALDAFGNKNIINGNISYDTIIKEGVNLFNSIWKFHAKSFIAPCYTWNSNIEPILYKEGIKYIQGSHVQLVPSKQANTKIKRKYHFTGQKNSLGQLYLVRNASFEPTENGKYFSLKNTLEEIELSFRYNKPAIISTHRLNYIGSINPKNREDNLLLLQKLLSEIIRKWPDVEFMSTDELGDLITLH